MKYSVAIATHNEEHSIVACLKSVYSWVDEVVVYDGNSTDRTKHVIKKFDTKKKIVLLNGKNHIMFHKNKQIAIDACRGDWIIQLDADEVVSPELAEEILTKTTSIIIGTNGYWLPRLNYFLGTPLTKGGQYPDHTLRVYRKGKGRLPCKSVHEQAYVEGNTEYMTHNLFHHPYRNIEDYINRGLVRYSFDEARTLYAKGERPSFQKSCTYLIILPVWWFIKTYFRHRGYVDGFAGFVFSLFSSIRYWVIYVRLKELFSSQRKSNPHTLCVDIIVL